MLANNYDLVLRASRVICPQTGLDGPGAIAVRAGRIVEVVDRRDGPPDIQLDFPTGILLPGLIDLHAHPATTGSVFGVAPDRWMLPCGVTTVLSQGDAGADNCTKYLENTIRPSRTRVRLAINLSRVGESSRRGCFEQLEFADIDACVSAIQRHREQICAIALNASHHACGATDPRDVLRRGLEASKRTGLPLLYGMRRPSDWPLTEQLACLRPRDVVTYCFRSEPHCIVVRGRVLPEVRAAQERGVLFDVGHGMNSFDFAVAEAAIADGFLPDTISTDLQRRHVNEQVVHDLPLVMSKLVAAGMDERDVFASVTSIPATVLEMRNEIGTLAIGTAADLVVLEPSPQPQELTDCYGRTRHHVRWTAAAVVRDGRRVVE